MKADGTNVDLLQLYGVQTQIGRFFAMIMDNLFTKQELVAITSDDVMKDDRYNVIKGMIIIAFEN